MKIKICGISGAEDIERLDGLEIEYCGVWWGVPKGINNLSTEQALSVLSTHTRYLSLVLVTLSSDLSMLSEICNHTRTRAVQLHGFHSPRFIKDLKARISSEIEIFKVLHMSHEGCLEAGFVDRYLEAGVDHLILDTYISKEKIGSTGAVIPIPTARSFVERINFSSVFIAGGITTENLNTILENVDVHGVDIDSGVKVNGRIDYSLVGEIKSLALNYMSYSKICS